MNLSRLLGYVRRYFWLVIVIILVTSLTTFVLLNRQPASYEAKTHLLVGPDLESASPDLNSLRIGGQLTQTYAELVTTHPFLEAINSKLNQNMDLATLEAMIETNVNVDTRILTIIVRHEDSRKAAAIANAAAEVLIEMSPSKENTTAALRVQMSNQSLQLEQVITSTEASIVELEAKLVELGSVRGKTPEEAQAILEQQNLIIRQLGDERGRLSDSIRTMATIYQVLLDTNTNQIVILESAVAGSPVNHNLPLRVMASGLAGLMFALILIFGIENLDNTIRVPGDLASSAKAPLLSVIGKHDRLDGSGTERVISLVQPNSNASNGYRVAVAKLLFGMGESTSYSILMSSGGVNNGDDAPVAAANLAVAFAQAGKQVVLVDAQFQNPVLTRLFNTEERIGLSDLLVSSSTKLQLASIKEMPGVRFLSAGLSADRGSGALLNPVKVNKIAADLQKEADIVLFTVSPISAYAESLTLASQVQGVILVARYGEARTQVNSVVDNLHSMKVQLIGTIFDHNPSPLISGQSPKNWRNLKTIIGGGGNKVSEQTVES